MLGLARNLLLLTVVLTASEVNAQVKIHPRLNGLDIGAKYLTIVKRLGKPLSDIRGGEVPCGAAMRTLRYRGLVLRLETGGAQPLGLYKVEVTSAKWSISGLRIGATRKQVISKFGSGPYFIQDGYAKVEFRRKRLVGMQWEFNFC